MSIYQNTKTFLLEYIIMLWYNKVNFVGLGEVC
jgi:hypothetical protein